MQLPTEVDVLAPDGSEIRVLLATEHASIAHGTLPPGGVSVAICHRTVHEIWYVLGGEGEIWRKRGEQEETVLLRAGACLTIPRGTMFQFRNVGAESLRFIMCTTPPWPGADEAVLVEGHWEAESRSEQASEAIFCHSCHGGFPTRVNVQFAQTRCYDLAVNNRTRANSGRADRKEESEP